MLRQAYRLEVGLETVVKFWKWGVDVGIVITVQWDVVEGCSVWSLVS